MIVELGPGAFGAEICPKLENENLSEKFSAEM
jgi:hypothetical protein